MPSAKSEAGSAPAATLKNADRVLLASLRRYASLRGLHLETLSHDWIAVLKKGERRHLAFGYDLGVNSSTAAKVANDKSATFQVLERAGIPAVEHRVFLHPRFLRFLPVEGNWGGLIAALADFRGDAVIKDNEGTGGMEVHRVRSQMELEQRAHELFQIARGVALSPYLPIEEETRLVLVDGECPLAYRKQRVSVEGDGRRTLAQLMEGGRHAGNLPPTLTLDNADWVASAVPGKGQRVPLQWRHNLGLGARPEVLDPASPGIALALQLARQALAALTLRFASIDVVRVDGRLMVLEANSGVMLESATLASSEGDALADRIYHRALDLALAGW